MLSVVKWRFMNDRKMCYPQSFPELVRTSLHSSCRRFESRVVSERSSPRLLRI